MEMSRHTVNVELLEDDTWSIPGVIALKDNTGIEYPAALLASLDEEIQSRVNNILIWNPNIDAIKMKATVDKGWVILEGTTDKLFSFSA